MSKILKALNQAYLEFQIAEHLEPGINIERRDQCERVADMCEKLAHEFDRVDFFPAEPITAPVENSGMKSTRKSAASFAYELREIGAGYRRHYQPLAKAITARRGDADQAREKFFQDVFRVWEEAGGRRVAPPTRPPAVPMAQFFLAVVEPLFGADAPKLPSLAAIAAPLSAGLMMRN